MLRRMTWIGLAAFLLATGGAQARDVVCGEACDTKMNQCAQKCEGLKKGLTEDSHHKSDDKYMDCWNECAKKEFHPCLDACKMPKPDFDEE